MPNLATFLDGYRNREQQMAAEPTRQLQQIGALQSLLANQQGMQEKKNASAREAAFAADLQALGPDATQEQLAAVGAKHTRDPKALLDIQQKSLDRKASLEQAREASLGRLEQQGKAAEMLHEFRLSKLQTDQDRAAEIARHNQAVEGLRAQQAEMDARFRGMGLNIQQQGLELRRDLAGAGGGGKAPSGYRYKADGTTLEPIPGGPATVQTPEQAAKTELLANGMKDVERFRGLVLKDGKPDRKLLMGMAVPGGGAPGTDSRLAYSFIYNAIEAKLRAESGAAVPETEVHRMAKRFVPGVLDNDKTINSKVDRLNEFLGGSLGRVKGQPGAGTGAGAAPAASGLSAEEKAELEALRSRFKK